MTNASRTMVRAPTIRPGVTQILGSRWWECRGRLTYSIKFDVLMPKPFTIHFSRRGNLGSDGAIFARSPSILLRGWRFVAIVSDSQHLEMPRLHSARDILVCVFFCHFLSYCSFRSFSFSYFIIFLVGFYYISLLIAQRCPRIGI